MLGVIQSKGIKGEVGAVKYFCLPFQGGTSFVDHLWYLCLVFVKLSRLFIAVLWSPAGKGLTYLLLFVMFIVFMLFSMWYPGSDVVLDCVVFRSLPYFLLSLGFTQ